MRNSELEKLGKSLKGLKMIIYGEQTLVGPKHLDGFRYVKSQGFCRLIHSDKTQEIEDY